MIDVIILSFAKSEKHHIITLNCLESLKNSDSFENFNIIIVESQPNINYEFQTIHLDKPFNYNQFANEAIRLGNNDLIGVFNNDLIFEKNWFTEIIKYEFESCSPISLTSNTQRDFYNDLKPIEGYKIARHISGWALVFTRKLWEKIGGLSEAYSFWCSDDVYAKQLYKSDTKHYLIPTSIVNHVENGSNTLKTLEGKLKNELTMEQARAWNKDNNDNKFGLK